MSFSSQVMTYNVADAASTARGERNDCTVKALAIATGASYDVAHAALAKHGRKKGRGCGAMTQHRALADLGFELVRAPYTAKTVKTLEREMQSVPGAYWAYTARHVLAIVEGKVEDHSKGGTRRVKSLFRVRRATPTPAPTPAPKPAPVRPAYQPDLPGLPLWDRVPGRREKQRRLF